MPPFNCTRSIRIPRLLGMLALISTSAMAWADGRLDDREKAGVRGAAEVLNLSKEFRDKLDNGRKVAIQILEFFDRHGVTIRRGDLRRVNRHRLDLFRHSQDADPRPVSVSGGESSPVGRPDFKSGRGRETVPGGFDSHSLPPSLAGGC